MIDLQSLIVSHTIYTSNRTHPIDAFGEIRVQHFVHLLDAVHSPVVRIALCGCLEALIQAKRDEVGSFDAVFCPKLGNTLLGSAVANALDKSSGFVRRSAVYDRFVETMAPEGCRAILVDDVSSEGRLLTDCVRNAAEDGFTIAGVFTVVDRTEGDACEAVSSLGLELYTSMRVGDQLLSEWRHEWRRSGGLGR